MSDSARKMKMGNSYLYEQNDYIIKDPSDSIFKRCMTEMKNNRVNFSNTKMSAFKHPDMDFDYFEPNNISNDGYLTLLKENDELRKNIFELRKNFIETVQNKDNQIKSLNYNMNMTIDNCERIIREAEENYMTLKLNYDRMKEDIINKEIEISNLSQIVRSHEATIAFYKDEIEKLKMERNSDRVYKDLESKLNEITKRYDCLSKEYESERGGINDIKASNEKLKTDNSNLKIQVENIRAENLSIRSQLEMFKKSNDMLSNESTRLKNDIESYKNEISGYKDKTNKLKTEISQLKKPGTSNDNATYVKHLEAQINEYKETISNIEKTQIVEYQKLLDESFSKISELQIDLQIALEKNSILEKKITQGKYLLYRHSNDSSKINQ
jgi:chromosome segregation ATPase